MARLLAKHCPTCGANIAIPPNVHHVPCRYCGNVIHVEHKAPPPQFHPFGTPGGVPSTTLYIDPNEIARAGRQIGVFVAVIVGISVIVPIIVGLVALVPRSATKKGPRSFPAVCAINEEIELTGNWEGPGPVVSSAGVNCKIHVSKAKLKGKTLIDSAASNVVITLEDVTLETTDVAIKGGTNTKVLVKGGSVKSAGAVIAGDSNLNVTLENTTIQSTGDQAIKTGYNLKLEATNAKIIGKTTAIDADANVDATLKKASEITSDGIAIKTKSGLKLETDGGKIDGGEGAIVATSGAKITARAATFASKATVFTFTSGAEVNLTDGSVVSQTDTAIDCDGGDFSFAGGRIQGAAAAISGKNGLKVKATKKAAIASVSGDGIEVTSNAQLTFTDASIDAARSAVKSTANTKAKLGAGTRLSGKNGGLIAEHNVDIDATGATIDGGSGPGIGAGYNARIRLQQGVLKGNPAIAAERKPQVWSVEGTRIEGAQKLPAR